MIVLGTDNRTAGRLALGFAIVRPASLRVVKAPTDSLARLSTVGGCVRVTGEKQARSAMAHQERLHPTVSVAVNEREFCQSWQFPGNDAVVDLHIRGAASRSTAPAKTLREVRTQL